MKKLAAYAAKRDFSVTKEPPAGVAKGEGRSFVVQKHAARRLHYDFRLELDGVLKSWAVPRGPSLSPGEKRLAVEVEDHPVDYRDFEGTIPEGQYGGGEVIVWDRGTWAPVGDPHAGLRKGHLRFTLDGDKLEGGFSLVRIRSQGREKKTNWLLLKARDEHVKEGKAAEITARAPASVITGRTIEDIASGVPARGKKEKRAAKKVSGKAAANLAHLEPELATLTDRVPTGPGWIFELKLDGYRALAAIDRGKARITTRSGLDWTERFPAIAEALGRLRVKDAVLDGEICYLDDEGKSQFQGLQSALSAGDERHLVYIVFDLLHRDGEDLRDRPLLERKEILATILAGERAPLMLCEHIDSGGEAFHEEACRLDLEGIIAKRADAPYTSGRTRSWLKIKCAKRQELIIVGYTAPKGSRKGLGALILGVREAKGEKAIRFAGKVGTGFSEESLADLRRRLDPLERATPAVADAPSLRDVTWVEPEIVCEVRFTEWTKDGVLRHPTFMGVREDKAAKEVVRERAARSSTAKAGPAKARKAARPKAKADPLVVRKVTITSADRVIEESSGVTKGELAAYYGAVADWIMPYARRRPLSVVRCPGGKAQGCFFQKHLMKGMGEAVRAAKAGGQEVMFISTATGLLDLAQFSAVEIHGWGSRLPSADKPDWIVIDLDPDEGLPFARVAEAAIGVREVLAGLDLTAWVKTTGGKGLHVVVPFRRRYGWDVVKRFAQAIAEDLERSAPEAFTTKSAKAARHGKIFIDYLRNAEGATAVLPYSARTRAGVTVAMPIAWDDVDKVHPGDFTVRSVPELLAQRREDPWADFFTVRQSLPPNLDEVLTAARVGPRSAVRQRKRSPKQA